VINEKSIDAFLLDVLRKYHGISEVWFLGSRANNIDVNDTSDWDFIVRCESKVFPLLSKDENLKLTADVLKIDLLVEFGGENLSSPWEEKHISKESLQWSTLLKNRAKYWRAKSRPRTAEEKIFLSDWEKYAIEQGADDSIDVSGWSLAKRVWPDEK
jgi:predicted nucleotidyltransferase